MGNDLTLEVKRNWLLVWVAITKISETGCLKEQALFLTVTEAGKFKPKGPDDLASGKISLSGLWLAAFQLFPHMAESIISVDFLFLYRNKCHDRALKLTTFHSSIFKHSHTGRLKLQHMKLVGWLGVGCGHKCTP